MYITRKKRQIIKNVFALILALSIMFFSLYIIPVIIRALPEKGAEYIADTLGRPLGIDTPAGAFGTDTFPAELIPFLSQTDTAPPVEKLEEDDGSENGRLTVTPVNLCWYTENDEPALYMHNFTDFDIDLDSFARRDFPFSSNGIDGPKVLIVHTHGTESYLPDGTDSYLPDETFRSTDGELNVTAVGREFAAVLEANGIGVIHDETMYDKDDFNSAYTLSRAAVYEWLEKYPSIRFVFDIHRDSVFDTSGGNQKPICSINGETAAQVMLVVGTNQDGAQHPYWRDNLTVATKLQQLMGEYYPTLARPVCLRTASFNQQCLPGMLLLEVGACGNTITEAKTAARLAATAFVSLYDSQMSE